MSDRWVELRTENGSIAGKFNPDCGILWVRSRGVDTYFELEWLFRSNGHAVPRAVIGSPDLHLEEPEKNGSR